MDSLEPLESFETTTNSFIVVIRSTPRKAGSNAIEWRGSVEHAQSRERIYFLEFSRLNEFIAGRCGDPSSPPSWRRRLSQRWGKTGLSKLLERLKIFSLMRISS